MSDPRDNPALQEPLWTVPNVLSFLRLGWSVVLFGCIAYQQWLAALCVFAIASLTDWLDGWWARRYQCGTILGRSLDPLIDKVLVCGAFVYLLEVPEAELQPWMVTLVLSREILITGVRGYIETLGLKFGADTLGKAKMFLQCAWLVAVFVVLSVRPWGLPTEVNRLLESLQRALLWTMLLATLLSGLQYFWRAGRLIQEQRKFVKDDADIGSATTAGQS